MTLIRKIILVGSSALILAGVGFFIGNYLKQESVLNSISVGKTEIGVSQKEGCAIKMEERIVRGNSLSPLIENGDTVKVLFGYYDCNDIKRNDIVLYSYAGNEDPLIKIVKGIPGDKFALQKTQVGCWNILINDKILENSQNSPYCISEQGYKMLSLYEKDYQGVIPEDAYLIMGNLISGATDSTRYGLVHKNDILGKAITIEAEPQ